MPYSSYIFIVILKQQNTFYSNLEVVFLFKLKSGIIYIDVS